LLIAITLIGCMNSWKSGRFDALLATRGTNYLVSGYDEQGFILRRL